MNNTSNTPRTDAVDLRGNYHDMLDLAQTLERELSAMTKERDEWKAKAEANERDAERYWWIVSQCTMEDYDINHDDIGQAAWNTLLESGHSESDISAAIDAARSAEKENE